AQLGNTWLPELVALHALAPLQQRVAASTAVAPPDYFASIWATNVSDGQLYGIPWYVDTRLLFYRSDLLKQAGFDAPPRDWVQWRRMLAALSHPGRKVYGILLPTNEYEPLLALALQQPDPLLRDGDRYGNFESEAFAARSRSTSTCSAAALRRRSRHRRCRTCGRSSAAARSRSTFRVRGTSASSSADCRPNCRTPGRP